MEQINFEEVLKSLNISPDTKHHSYEYLYNSFKTVWNKAIEAAAEEVKLKVLSKYEVNNPYVDIPFVVDKQSILKLKV